VYVCGCVRVHVCVCACVYVRERCLHVAIKLGDTRILRVCVCMCADVCGYMYVHVRVCVFHWRSVDVGGLKKRLHVETRQ